MTVAEFKAALEATGIDPFEEIRFYDKDGNVQEVTLTQVGPTHSIIPSEPEDPAHLVCKLQMPG